MCFRRSTGHLDSQTQLGSVGAEIVGAEICASWWCADGVLRVTVACSLDVVWVFLQWARTEKRLPLGSFSSSAFQGMTVRGLIN